MHHMHLRHLGSPAAVRSWDFCVRAQRLGSVFARVISVLTQVKPEKPANPILSPASEK